MSEQYSIINSFPDFKEASFDLESYNQQFRDKNILINARASQVYYPEHWGPLSIKAVFEGTEHYLLNNSEYAVTDKNYLIVNDGNYYGSYIDSDHTVESC
ncbi:MAG: hypothetical protein ACXVPE_17675, partial [Bacteroidia bacterium]